MTHELNGVTYRTVPMLGSNANCGKCAAQTNRDLCDALQVAHHGRIPCFQVVWIENTPEALADYIASKLTA